MAIFASSATYQGYPAQGLQFRRSVGLRPEVGYVDLEYVDFKVLKIKQPKAPWRPAQGFEVPGLGGINGFFKFIQQKTVTDSPQLPEIKPPKGLGLFGDLVLNRGITTKDAKGDAKTNTKKTIYKDIYIAPSGIEELNQNLLNAQDHNEGTVRVPLTDIRTFYAGYSPIILRVNVRLRSGEYDKDSLDAGIPWTLRKLLVFLFFQLPGSPSLHTKSAIFKSTEKFAEPNDLVYEGEPAAAVIEDLLQKYGLVAGLQPDNTYFVGRAYDTKLKQGEIADAVASAAKPDYISYEKKVETNTNRPTIITAVGRRRVRRQTLAYVPVFKNTDGRIYRLSDVGLVIPGYSLNDVNFQVVADPDRNFRNVPPEPTDADTTKLHKQRRDMLRKWAYRAYAPECFFTVSEGFKGSVPDPPFITDRDIVKLPFLPMTDVPMLSSELATLGVDVPTDKLKEGDLGKFVLLPPIIRGSRVDEDFYTHFGQVQAYFNATINAQQDLISDLNGRATFLDAQAQQAAASYLQSPRVAFKQIQAIPDFLKQIGEIKTQALEELSKLFEHGAIDPREFFFERLDLDLVPLIALKVRMFLADAAKLREQAAAAQADLAPWQAAFNKLKAAYEKVGGLLLWSNVPNHVIADGFTLDPETGILFFDEPVFQMSTPFALTRELTSTLGLPANTAVVGAASRDGRVSVTFGYELKDNTPLTFTMVSFAADPNDESEKTPVSFVGLCRTMPFKTAFERVANLRLYELDQGTPINVTAVVTEAYGVIEHRFKIPKSVTGYIYQIPGFEQVVLSDGVDNIQYLFDGDKGSTFVTVNAGKTRVPLGPAIDISYESGRPVDQRRAIQQIREVEE